MIIAQGPIVPACGSAAPWRSVLVQEKGGGHEYVVYAEYFREDDSSEYTYGSFCLTLESGWTEFNSRVTADLKEIKRQEAQIKD